MKYILFIAAACSVLCSCGSKTSNDVTTQRGPDTIVKGTPFPPHNSIVGKTFADPKEIPLLAGYRDEGGTLLGSDPMNKDYAIAHFTNGTNHLILFEKVNQSTEQVKYLVLDTLVIDGSTFDPGQTILFTSCRKDSLNDPEIIAVVKQEKKERFDKIAKAWRASKGTGRIMEIINPKRITCLNELYGQNE